MTYHNENEKTIKERICKFCIHSLALASWNRFITHNLIHLKKIDQEILMMHYRWCQLCSSSIRIEPMFELKRHLLTKHSEISRISYYYLHAGSLWLSWLVEFTIDTLEGLMEQKDVIIQELDKLDEVKENDWT